MGEWLAVRDQITGLCRGVALVWPKETEVKLYRRYSETPLLELRTDFGSDRTVAGRPYVWFTELERGKLKRRMKAIPLPIEQAITLLEWSLDFLLVTSGQTGASRHIHDLVKRLDDDRFAIKVTPRKGTSRWSDINRRRWTELNAAGLLAPAGLAAAPTEK